jgi:hypothetical protein
MKWQPIETVPHNVPVIVCGKGLCNSVVGCSHDWREPIDTQFCNEKYAEVKCTKCGMVGEKTIATGEVFFPAT